MKLTNKTKGKEYYEVGQWFLNESRGAVGVLGFVAEDLAQLVFVGGSRWADDPVELNNNRITVKVMDYLTKAIQ